MDAKGAALRLSAFSARLSAAVGAGLLIPLLSAHVGSPDVFFKGAAGPYAIQVVVRPPEVVPGVAQVTVLATADVQSVSIRPVFWRAGSRGAPQADPMRRVEGNPPSWAGSLWLMANGAYTVDVIVNGAHGSGHVLVPVPSVARGRLDLDPKLAALLAVLGLVLVAGLVNIVHKAAGESLVDAYGEMDDARRRTARRASAVAIPVIALAVFGGSRWWNAVDKGYERTLYETPALQVSNNGGILSLENPVLRRWSGRSFPMLRDHGKLMHLFLIRADDARAFAHLHPDFASDTSSRMTTVLPPLPAGSYHVFGDVVDETGFEHTAVATLEIADANRAGSARTSDPDDAWFIGDATRTKSTRLEDGSTMTLDIVGGAPQKGVPLTLRVTVADAAGKPIRLEPYLGMAAHAVVTRVDGKVFVHVHPMGTITLAAQDAFAARDRGDTTAEGHLNMPAHRIAPAMTMTPIEPIEFPYAFPKNGAYRIFVQVKHNGRVQTGAFAVTVAEQTDRQ